MWLQASKPSLSADESTGLFHKLRALPQLQQLRCRFLKEDCDDVAGLSNELQHFTSLTELVLEQCFVNRGKQPRGDGVLVTGHIAGIAPHPCTHLFMQLCSNSTTCSLLPSLFYQYINTCMD